MKLGMKFGIWSFSLFGPIVASMLTVSLGVSPSFAVALQTIRDRGFLSVGVKTNLFPMGFRDESGTLVGFEIEMARKLAQELLGSSDAVRLIPVQNVDRLQAVADGRVDLVIAAVTATDSRRRWVDFSAPYYFERSMVAVQAVDPISPQNSPKTLADLRGESVAVLKGASAIEALEDLDASRLTIVEVESYEAGLAQLRSGQVKALVGDRVMLLGILRQSPTMRLLQEEFGLYPMSIAMPKGIDSASLRSGVNEAIDRWQQNGWLREQWLQWNLDR
jgi:polar amino acid transport system substrate-binding protein